VAPVSNHVREERAERIRRLTPAGWPRPRRADREGNVFPVAWITLAPDFAAMDPDRGVRAITDRLCQVCGEGHGEDGEVVIFLDAELRDAETFEKVHPGYDFPAEPQDHLDRLVLKAKDGAMLHDRCARLAVATCPHLRTAKDRGRLFGFAGSVADIFVRHRTPRPSEVYLPGRSARVWLIPERYPHPVEAT
jgi:hypothetical protein